MLACHDNSDKLYLSVSAPEDDREVGVKHVTCNNETLLILGTCVGGILGFYRLCSYFTFTILIVVSLIK
jgi:hypothetical protein